MVMAKVKLLPDKGETTCGFGKCTEQGTTSSLSLTPAHMCAGILGNRPSHYAADTRG